MGLQWHSKEGPFKLVLAAILGLTKDPEASPKPLPQKVPRFCSGPRLLSILEARTSTNPTCLHPLW